MIALLAFVLECAAAAALVGLAASLASRACFAAVRPALSRVSAARRADVVLWLAFVPAAAVLLVVGGAALVSLGAAAGLLPDHCPSHDHHPHLCLVHFGGLRPALAALGAIALAVQLFRAGQVLGRHVEAHGRLRVLEQLGERLAGAVPVVAIPGTSGLCHAAGVLRPRVLVGRALWQALSADELRAALAHEQAHLTRRDPLAFLMLAAASVAWTPGLLGPVSAAFHAAVEESCDAHAAAQVGDPLVVADALVKVAALQAQGAPAAGLAFGEAALEGRVQRLLDPNGPRAAGTHWLAVLPFAGAALAAALVFGADALHHAVETALHLVF